MKKKVNYFIYSMTLMGIFLIISSSCNKKEESNNNPNAIAMTDIDGNTYHAVIIGTQEWMIENLKVTKYQNGDPVTNVKDQHEWGYLPDGTGAYCVYENDSSYNSTYGVLYNWYAVNDVRKLAPVGWHVPSNAEWNTLFTFLKGEDIACGKMKSTGNRQDGTGLWNKPNTGATNSSRFTAFPGGYRDYDYFDGLYESACFWTSEQDHDQMAGIIVLYYNKENLSLAVSSEHLGCSIRCIKD